MLINVGRSFVKLLPPFSNPHAFTGTFTSLLVEHFDSFSKTSIDLEIFTDGLEKISFDRVYP